MAGAIIAVANLKGGVGKTTLAVNLAAQLADRGKVVLVRCRSAGNRVRVDRPWPADRGRGPAARYEAEADKWAARVRQVAGDAELVIIDLPPALGAAAASAMMLAALAIIPVTPSSFDLRATARALDLVKEARELRRTAGRKGF